MEKFIKSLARGAGKILREGFRTKFKINHKSAPWDVVTEFDLASEKFIMDKIRKKFPTHGIMSEESGLVIKAKNMWVIDPLDGTRGFSRGLPQYSVSIAFVENNTIKLGAIYDPSHDELFYAKNKKGAFLNNKRIKVHHALELDHTLASLHIAFHNPVRSRVYKNAVEQNIFPVNLTSIALSAAQVAAGRIETIISAGLNPWDYCAAAIILKEAGAKVTDLKGQPYRWDSKEMVAGNPVIHKKLIKLVH
ncbi:MAG: inositol monophosphatase family protein [bacterium]|nr:inositol monophosphatase family protein [bacterium]